MPSTLPPKGGGLNARSADRDRLVAEVRRLAAIGLSDIAVGHILGRCQRYVRTIRSRHAIRTRFSHSVGRMPAADRDHLFRAAGLTDADFDALAAPRVPRFPLIVRRHTPQFVGRVRELAGRGLTDLAVGAELGVTGKAVEYCRVRHGIGGRTKRPRHDHAAIRAMHAAGRTDREIADALGIPPKAVRNARHWLRLGVGPRGSAANRARPGVAAANRARGAMTPAARAKSDATKAARKARLPAAYGLPLSLGRLEVRMVVAAAAGGVMTVLDLFTTLKCRRSCHSQYYHGRLARLVDAGLLACPRTPAGRFRLGAVVLPTVALLDRLAGEGGGS